MNKVKQKVDPVKEFGIRSDVPRGCMMAFGGLLYLITKVLLAEDTSTW